MDRLFWRFAHLSGLEKMLARAEDCEIGEAHVVEICRAFRESRFLSAGGSTS